jgi:hypothetical protein
MKAWKISSIILAILLSLTVTFFIFYDISITKIFQDWENSYNFINTLLNEKEIELNNCITEEDIVSSNLSIAENKLSLCSENFDELFSEVSPFKISWKSASSHVGEYKIVCGPVANKNLKGSPVFIDIGYPYPLPGRFSIVSWDKFTMGFLKVASVQRIVNNQLVSVTRKNICVIGLITLYKGTPQIVVNNYSQILYY